MKIKDFIVLPIIGVENLRDWYLNQKREKERKKMLGANKDEVRIRPHTEIENEETMKKFIMKGTYTDSDGKQKKIERLGRSVESYRRG